MVVLKIWYIIYMQIILHRKLPFCFNNNRRKVGKEPESSFNCRNSVVPWHARWQVHRRNEKWAKVLWISICEKQPPTFPTKPHCLGPDYFERWSQPNSLAGQFIWRKLCWGFCSSRRQRKKKVGDLLLWLPYWFAWNYLLNFQKGEERT